MIAGGKAQPLVETQTEIVFISAMHVFIALVVTVAIPDEVCVSLSQVDKDILQVCLFFSRAMEGSNLTRLLKRHIFHVFLAASHEVSMISDFINIIRFLVFKIQKQLQASVSSVAGSGKCSWRSHIVRNSELGQHVQSIIDKEHEKSMEGHCKSVSENNLRSGTRRHEL